MKRAVAALVVFATLACTSSRSVDDMTQGAIQQLTQAVAQNPTHQPLIYILATHHGKARDSANVVKWLKRLDELGWDYGVARHDFRNITTRDFRAIAAKLNARVPRVQRAQTAFTLANQRDLVPEGITYDPVDDVFYVSGIYRRKVLRVDRSGNATDFITEAQDGMLGGLGVKVDAMRRLSSGSSARRRPKCAAGKRVTTVRCSPRTISAMDVWCARSRPPAECSTISRCSPTAVFSPPTWDATTSCDSLPTRRPSRSGRKTSAIRTASPSPTTSRRSTSPTFEASRASTSEINPARASNRNRSSAASTAFHSMTEN